MKKGFILGNPRSGTSLLRIMLNTHSEIAAPPECGFLQWWFNKYKTWSKDDFSGGNLERFIADLFSSKKIETWNLDENKLRKFLIDEQPLNYSELTLKVYEFWGLKNEALPKIIIDKNNYYIHHLDEINEIWPDAFYILLVRDGRDVACSYKNMESIISDSPYKPNLPTNIKEIAREWKKNQEQIIKFLKNLESDRYIVIKYEDLIIKTKKVLTKVCYFLGEEFQQQMLLYYIQNKNREIEPNATLDWKKKTLKKPDKGNLEKYKEQLTQREINIFNKIAGEMLKEFDYLF